MFEFKVNHIYTGNSLKILQQMPSKSVNCIITSPPYFQQRGYATKPQVWGGDKDCIHKWDLHLKKGISGGKASKKVQIKGSENFQITKDTKYGVCEKCGAVLCELGQNPTIESYVNGLCDIFEEAKRVLSDFGTCWVNLGDKSNGGGGAGSQGSKYRDRHTQFGKTVSSESQSLPIRINDVPKQSLMMIPERFAIEMINRGWILKNKIIWHKLSVMPQSSPKKFTTDWEYIFFFVKNNKPLYYINKLTNQLQKEKPLGVNGIEGTDWFLNNNNRKQSYWTSYSYYFKQQFTPLKQDAKNIKFGGNKHEGYENPTYSGNEYDSDELIGVNMRCVWDRPTANLKENHFAAYNTKLIETPIDAGCPQFVCPKCSLPVQPYYKKGEAVDMWKKQSGGDSNGEYKGKAVKDYDSNNVQNVSDVKRRILDSLTTKYEMKARCNCNVKLIQGIVLDVFMGSGTSAIEALNQHKLFIGCELNPKYVDIAWKRITPHYNPNGLW